MEGLFSSGREAGEVFYINERLYFNSVGRDADGIGGCYIGLQHLSLAHRAVNLSFHIQTYQYSLKTFHLCKSFWEKVPYLGVLDIFFS